MRLLLACAVMLAIPAGDPAGDQKEIQGTWQVLMLMDSGEAAPVAKTSRMVITKDKLVLKDRAYPIEINFELDPTKMPKSIDLVSQATRYPGIYELKGDSLRICYNERPRGERPTAFGSAADSPSDVLLVLQREKK